MTARDDKRGEADFLRQVRDILAPLDGVAKFRTSRELSALDMIGDRLIAISAPSHVAPTNQWAGTEIIFDASAPSTTRQLDELEVTRIAGKLVERIQGTVPGLHRAGTEAALRVAMHRFVKGHFAASAIAQISPMARVVRSWRYEPADTTQDDPGRLTRFWGRVFDEKGRFISHIGTAHAEALFGYTTNAAPQAGGGTVPTAPCSAPAVAAPASVQNNRADGSAQS